MVGVATNKVMICCYVMLAVFNCHGNLRTSPCAGKGTWFVTKGGDRARQAMGIVC